MSKNSRRRISRMLVAVVAVTLGLGSGYWMYQLGQSSALREQSARRTSAAAPLNAAAHASQPTGESHADAGVLTLVTPTTRPSAPLLMGSVQVPVDGSAATTRPADQVHPAAAGAGGATSADQQASADRSQTASGSAAVSGTTTAAGDRARLASGSRQPTTAPSAGAAPASATLPPITLSAAPLIDAKAKIDAGKLLDGRRILNAALQGAHLTDSESKSAKLLLNQINDQVVFSSRRFPDDEFGGTMVVPPGGVLAKIARSHDITPELLMRMNGITDPRRLRAGQTLKVVSGPFNAVVTKHDFTLEIWLGEPGGKASQYITSFPVGLGQDDSTPTGVWAIQNKLKNPAYYSPRGQGVIAADDPKNPLGEYWLGLTGTDGHAVGKQSYGIHGTIDPSSIGKQSSMGCIRLTNENVARVFELLVDGKSTVTVKD